MENLSHLGFQEMLSESFYARSTYEDQFNIGKDAFNSPLVNEVKELYNQFIRLYDTISEFQIKVLTNILNEVNEIKLKIDPNRLKDIEHDMNEDGDLLLFRNTSNGLINLIIHEDESFAFSYIGKENDTSLEFYSLEEADFEHLVLKFFSF